MTTPALAENVKGKGRHYRHPVTGELVPSITNVIGALDKPALPRWAASEVAKRAATMKASLGNMTDNEVVDTLKGAPFNRSKRAAERGTDIHGYLEALLNGWEPEELSRDAVPYKQAADEWLDYHQPEMIATELSVFDGAYAGTGDLWCRFGDRLAIVDFKTSKAIYGEASLQLAALYGCQVDGEGQDVPHAGEEADLFVVRIGVDGWEQKQVADPEWSLTVFRSLLDVWDWQKNGRAYL